MSSSQFLPEVMQSFKPVFTSHFLNFNKSKLQDKIFCHMDSEDWLRAWWTSLLCLHAYLDLSDSTLLFIFLWNITPCSRLSKYFRYDKTCVYMLSQIKNLFDFAKCLVFHASRAFIFCWQHFLIGRLLGLASSSKWISWSLVCCFLTFIWSLE